MHQTALITGITGQDGSYLAELLLSKGYVVHGLVRRTSTVSTSRLNAILGKVTLHSADLLDEGCLIRLLAKVKPDEVYNLASQSFVPASWEQPVLTGEVTGLGALRMLEAVRQSCPGARFYQAGTSEMFGQVQETPQTERTPFYPRSPYGVAKCYAHWATVNYRESYGLFACSGILFNHESPRRGTEFVTRKITQAVAHIKHGLQDKLQLGNLAAKRDWGHAKDYVRAMWMMLQASQPTDYVVATGESHTVEEFVQQAFDFAGLPWRQHVVTDQAQLRPAEVHTLQGNARKIRDDLNWQPEISFDDLVQQMVLHDLAAVVNRHACPCA